MRGASDSVHRQTLELPVTPQRQERTVPNCAEERRDSTAQFLGMVLMCPLLCAGGGPDSAVTVEVPKLQFIDSRRHSWCGAEANPEGSANCEKTVEFRQVQFFAWLCTSAACVETSGMSPR